MVYGTPKYRYLCGEAQRHTAIPTANTAQNWIRRVMSNCYQLSPDSSSAKVPSKLIRGSSKPCEVSTLSVELSFQSRNMDYERRSPRKDERYDEEAVISLPLLDDVNELIEKEKILLEFKVLEQQKGAFEWKAKYDSLLGKVAENANMGEINDNFKILADVADSDLVTADGPDISNLMDYIHKFGDHYILDMSGKSASFVVSQITQGASLLKHYSTVLNAVSFRDVV